MELSNSNGNRRPAATPREWAGQVVVVTGGSRGIGRAVVECFAEQGARVLEFVVKAKIEVVYFSILTPYPGTRLHRRLAQAGRILTRDWSLYDANHVVYKPTTFTPDQLREGYLRALQEVYSLPAMARRLWGTTAWKNLFWPMNFGFRQGVRRLARANGQGR